MTDRGENIPSLDRFKKLLSTKVVAPLALVVLSACSSGDSTSSNNTSSPVGIESSPPISQTQKLDLVGKIIGLLQPMIYAQEPSTSATQEPKPTATPLATPTEQPTVIPTETISTPVPSAETPTPGLITSTPPPPEQPTKPTEPSPTTEAKATATEAVLGPEQQLAEYMKTDEAKKSVDQFVTAMTSAGIGVTAEQVNQGLTIKELKDKDGHIFTVTVTSDGYPLFISTQNNETGRWQWSNASLRYFGEMLNIKIGTDLRIYMTSRENGKQYLNDFDFGFIESATYNNGDEKNIIDNEVLTLAPQIKTLLLHEFISPGHTYPPALETAINNQDVETTKGLLKQYIIDTMDKFPNINAINLINESRIPIRDDDQLMKLLGEDYILYSYRVAREHAKETNRDIKLLFSETANHYPGEYTDSTLYFSKKLAAEGLIDAVAVQGHLLLNEWIPDVDKNQMTEIFRNYPVPVWITEADVNLTSISGSGETRSKKLSQEYVNLVGACIESGNCQVISFFNGWDSESWLENGSIDSGGQNADGTLYSGTDTDHHKRLAYYDIAKTLFTYIQGK